MIEFRCPHISLVDVDTDGCYLVIGKPEGLR